MNDKPLDQEPGPVRDAPGDARLRWQLRGLRKDVHPARDLWPQIATRIARTPVATVPRRADVRRWAPLALAASLLLAVGLAWQLRPLPGASKPSSIPAAPTSGAPAGPGPALLDREADAMAREYDAALGELRAAAPLPSTPTPQTAALRELDRSALQIRAALERDPDARFLLDRLRRTYAQRLALTQRAIPT